MKEKKIITLLALHAKLNIRYDIDILNSLIESKHVNYTCNDYVLTGKGRDTVVGILYII